MSESRERESEQPSARRDRSAKLFDVRTVIGGLFLVYGVLVGSAGLFPTEEGLDKAQGVNINLWTGLSMLLVGGIFLLWVRLRPLETPTATDEGD
ncbi:hypothetical protein SAMN04487905_107133 [Actinopolyspora xinjiangensis]|uniref:Uncharacterized protein n=1 Tax=Actinopolyspora xinjiangensis TaxID=405564 RepID=A0A1H0UT57_9ACTN|nr:hypothetical protein [Actinopolyspora xinjiangensis]SDP69382.1 hypothetical protein SAMN04487905_107133 [Actinopolyspora xinjiangensis]